MFLRKLMCALSILFITPLCAGVYEAEGNSTESYNEDIAILKKKIAETPSDLKLRKDLITFLMAVEKFSEAKEESDLYLSKNESAEIRYIRIIALANQSKYGEAALAVDEYIAKHKPSKEITANLKKKKKLYEQAYITKADPAAFTQISEVASLEARGFYDEDTLIVYNKEKATLQAISPTTLEAVPLPSLPKETNSKKLLHIDFDQSKTRCIAAFRSGKQASIALSFKSGSSWSSWSKPAELNKGSVNNYPSFIYGSSDILFVSNRSKTSGMDIYSATVQEKGIVNVKKVDGANTSMDEVSLFVEREGKTLNFSSNGRSGLGGFDLYVASLYKSGGVWVLKGVKNITAVNTFRNEASPLYISAKKSGYIVNYQNADKTNALYAKSISLTPVEIPQSGTFVAKEIYFDTGSAIIRSNSYPFLQTLYLFLQNNPSKKVKVAGHADNVGSEALNKKLSTNRAKAVVDYLVSKGIDKDRLSYVGYGESKQAATNETIAGRQKNRRVELTIFE